MRKCVEVEREVDTGEEGFVKDFDTVSSEEDDAPVVFEMAQAERRGNASRLKRKLDERLEYSQHGDHSISFQIMKRTLLKEHIRLHESRGSAYRHKKLDPGATALTSSMSTIAFHVVATSNTRPKAASRSTALVPRSPAPTT
jgi:hypothetical protein